MGVVPPPQIHTVKKTMSSVVENIICLAYVAVSLMERAKVIAPRSPERDIMKVSHLDKKDRKVFLNASGTWKHHDVLEIGCDFVLAAEIQQKRQGVDIGCPAEKYGQLEMKAKVKENYYMFTYTQILCSDTNCRHKHTHAVEWLRKDTNAPIMKMGLNTWCWKEKSVKPM